MKHTLRIFHETGHWGYDGPYERYNASKEQPNPNRFTGIEIDEKENWVIEMINWNRYYHMQNGKKAAYITKVHLYEDCKPREIIIKPIYAKLICFILNLLPKKILRKRKLWFGL